MIRIYTATGPQDVTPDQLKEYGLASFGISALRAVAGPTTVRKGISLVRALTGTRAARFTNKGWVSALGRGLSSGVKLRGGFKSTLPRMGLGDRFRAVKAWGRSLRPSTRSGLKWGLGGAALGAGYFSAEQVAKRYACSRAGDRKRKRGWQVGTARKVKG